MTPHALIAEAARCGIELYAEGCTIRYRGPKTALLDLKPKLAACKGELLSLLRVVREEVEIDRPAGGWRPMPEPGHPAYNILETCERFGVLLRIDENGELVVGKEGAKADEPTQPWPSLIIALEAHLKSVAALVRAGWSLKADVPRYPLA